MRPRPGEARASREPPSRQTLRTRHRPLLVQWAAMGNGELEGSAAPGFRFHPDSSTLALDNLLAQRQTDASAGNFLSVQPFEHAEDAVFVLRFDTDSIVPHCKTPRFRIFLRRDVDGGRFPGSVLDRIGNQVLEKLHQHY